MKMGFPETKASENEIGYFGVKHIHYERMGNSPYVYTAVLSHDESLFYYYYQQY